MYVLEEQAVKRGLDYQLFKDQLEPLRSIEKALYLQTQRQIEKDGQKSAAENFSSQTGPLNDGFARIAQTSADSLDQALKGEVDRNANVDKKWEATVQYQQALEDRHNTRGHALNYAERYERIVGLLAQDVGIAYQKLRCLVGGCNQVFGLNVELRDPFEYGYLDYTVAATRDLLNKVEIATVEQIQFDHIVALHQPKSIDAKGGRKDPPYTDGKWIEAMNSDGLLTISLKNEFPTAIKRVRLRAIGLSYGLSLDVSEKAKLGTISAVVTPPEVPNVFSSGSTKRRSPIILEGVGLTDSSSPKWLQSSAVTNIDPRGDWKIKLSPNVVFQDMDAHRRDSGTVRDIKLHLRLTALVDKDGDWSDFNA